MNKIFRTINHKFEVKNCFSPVLISSRPTYTPPTHTHTLECKEKERQYSRMQGKWSKVKNFPSEERKQSKNHCSPVKLESEKNN